MTRYKSDAAIIRQLKDDYLHSNLNMKDVLNGEYRDLPAEDKVILIGWSRDDDRFEVLDDGSVVDIKSIEITYYPEEILEVLCGLSDVDYTDKQKMECIDALSYIKACAENPRNSDFFRTFYDMLQDVTEKYGK